MQVVAGAAGHVTLGIEQDAVHNGGRRNDRRILLARRTLRGRRALESERYPLRRPVRVRTEVCSKISGTGKFVGLAAFDAALRLVVFRAVARGDQRRSRL